MNKFSTWLWRTAFWLRYKVGYGLKVYGRDNFPMEGPVIVVPNHLSNNDPPICGYALPRHVHFMAKQELFVNPISRFFCTWLGAFPLNRGAIDKIAIRHALGLLKNNKVLGIFAEGNRQKNGKLGRFHDGPHPLRCVQELVLPQLPLLVLIICREIKLLASLVNRYLLVKLNRHLRLLKRLMNA